MNSLPKFASGAQHGEPLEGTMACPGCAEVFRSQKQEVRITNVTSSLVSLGF